VNPALRRSVAHLLVADVEAAVLDDESAHHLLRVLRARDGETITVTDGAGRWRVCRITGHAIEPAGDVAVESPPPTPLTVCFVVPKSDRPEWMVQKLTEIGIDRIVLLESRRSVVRWDDERAAKALPRLRRVAAEAVQQSRRVYLPEIRGPVVASELISVSGVATAEPGGATLDAIDQAVAIGPEGGWDPDELAVAARTVDLGETVLRVETAAVVAATLMCALRRSAP
jgi:16S rRNA (uracil1498-N3)-methyltransferase